MLLFPDALLNQYLFACNLLIQRVKIFHNLYYFDCEFILHLILVQCPGTMIILSAHVLVHFWAPIWSEPDDLPPTENLNSCDWFLRRGLNHIILSVTSWTVLYFSKHHTFIFLCMYVDMQHMHLFMLLKASQWEIAMQFSHFCLGQGELRGLDALDVPFGTTGVHL